MRLATRLVRPGLVRWALPLLIAVPAVAEDVARRLAGALIDSRANAAAQLALELETTLPQAAPTLALLRGRLAEAELESDRARSAYTAALAGDGAVEALAGIALGALELREATPEVAAGLLATALGHDPPPEQAGRAMRDLAAALSDGGDCRILGESDGWHLSSEGRRWLELARADCLQDSAAAAGRWRALLADEAGDDVGLAAAERLAASGVPADDRRTTRLVGLALYGHRAFETAVPLLRRLDGPAVGIDSTSWENGYALARSLFWLERYAEAADVFERLAANTASRRSRADASFQQGRCRELDGDWSGARESFRRAFDADPTGSWSGASLIARMRLELRGGDETGALETFTRLGSRGSWRTTHGQAALFLAASDVVRRRADRAGTWLDAAAATAPLDELAYWRGRLAEVAGNPDRAARQYLLVQIEAPAGPFARSARGRFARLAEAQSSSTIALAKRVAPMGREAVAAWAASWPASPREVRGARHHFSGRESTRELLEGAIAPPSDWPVWRRDPPEALFHALAGLPDGKASRRWLQDGFPLDDVGLALARARLLAAPVAPHRSIRTAELVANRLPDEVPRDLLADDLRRLLYPDPYARLVRREGARRDVDPWLLNAIMREESRFDADAVSQAAAHGLTQFVLPTARRLAPEVGLSSVTPGDLHRPEVAIALGAAYVAELGRLFDGTEHLVLAAYNAGEPQAALWSSYCYSTEPVEYLTKIGFRQTRAYVRKVLTSLERYRALARAAEPSGSQSDSP